MTSNIEEIEKRALELSTHERALLIRQLLNSLEDEIEEENTEEMWIKAAEKRYNKYKRGKTGEKLANDVLKDAKTNLK
ncbi:MAG: hypothetical protein GF329_10985 [Candidatus Lokiarchaeota archaeon]|nr:hypothetical protein [Candidatus Lokiarchaeota archaeon]